MMKTKPILEKAYDPKPVEEKWNKFWEEEELFVAQGSSPKKKFSMVLPPPNVTGRLHIGHALCFTLPDIVVRWRRMQGYNTLWLPGIDHASIAVHNVVEQNLAEKGLSRQQIGREKFLETAREWKEKHGNIIINQLKKLGASLDWTRERFTLDDGYRQAVRHVFVNLYDESLIYRDYYLVNRCPHCGTVLSDIEVEHQELKGKLYYIKYPLEDSEDFVVVATTRPETMLGDTGVAVHPEDERYSKIQAKKVNLPLTNRVIPIILDDMVDMEFGTGAVKVTPAHDPVDYELGKKHNLEQIIVIDGSGKMTEDAGEEFKGLDRFECREKVLQKLKEAGLLEKVEDYQHAVGHCYRCKTIIEPNLSWQWFVKVEPLAKEAIRVVEEGDIQFIPPNWAKTYFEWMYNIHDWCISRQLWWGHRIPAWYCQDCEEMIVAMEAPKECPRCKSSRLVQDEDVLDTWFSSALWPFATLGWPEKTEDLKVFYPTDLMSTGFDIIFFWVARMIMMGLKFARAIPFKHVFINGLVRDFRRRKMSKSEGNVIDPLDMIEKYGTDALRFTMAALAIPGMDLSLSEERMAGYRAFANKVWNASRFVLMNIGEEDFEIKDKELTLADRWIRSRTDRMVEELNKALEEYKFYEAADKIYHFVWHEFCDWYIELVKPALKEKNKTSQTVLVESLDLILKLLHPFMPFISEEIWQHLPLAQKSLAVAPFPESDRSLRDEKAEVEMGLLQKAIVEVRTLRAENRIPPRVKVELWMKVKDKEEKSMIETYQIYFQALANIRNIEFVDQFPPEKKLLKGVVGSWEMAISLEGDLDLEQEKKRLEREISKLSLNTEKLESRLKNKNFIDRAPQNVVQETKEKLKSLQNRKAKLEESLKSIS